MVQTTQTKQGWLMEVAGMPAELDGAREDVLDAADDMLAELDGWLERVIEGMGRSSDPRLGAAGRRLVELKRRVYQSAQVALLDHPDWDEFALAGFQHGAMCDLEDSRRRLGEAVADPAWRAIQLQPVEAIRNG